MSRWTDAQRAAIESRGQNLLVSAAAGAGKTAVMVERVLRRVLDDRVPVTRLLVVTFTKAAAAEMRVRIAEALEKAQEEAPDPFLRQQADSLDESWISTVDAFCARLLRRYYPVAGVDPGFSVLAEDEAAILRADALDAVLEEAFEALEPGFAVLADALGGSDGLALGPLVERLYDFAVTRPEGLPWLDRAVEDLPDTPEALLSGPLAAALVEQAAAQAGIALAMVEQAVALCAGPGGPAAYIPALQEDCRQLQALAGARTYPDFMAALRALDFGRLGRRGKDDDPALADTVQKLRAKAKYITGALEKSALAAPPEEEMERIARLREHLSILVGLTRAYAERYAALKAARGSLDFNDVERAALRVVADPAVGEELRETFTDVFIDEYQDTNPLQEALITALTRGDNLFCVGDVKQSIYRFRQAEPRLFLARYQRSSPDPGAPDRRIDLNANFRSHPAVLRGINDLFSRLMSDAVGGVTYDDSAALHPGLPETPAEGPLTSFYVLHDSGEGEEDDGPQDEAADELEDMRTWEKEALHAAALIRERVGRPLWDSKRSTLRPARYSDFAILMRTIAGRGHAVARVLEDQGIPVMAQGGAAFLDRVEIAWLRAALQLIDNRWQDIPLLTALHSPLADMTLDELAAIRAFRPGRDVPFAQAAREYAQTDMPGADKLRAFFARLMDWKARAPMLPVDRLIWLILDETGLYDRVGALPDGDMRRASLRTFAQRARDLCQGPARDLYGFLSHLDRLKERDADLEPARPMAEGADAVQVMSVHRSKGLEFPVVIVLGLGHRFSVQDANESLLLHGELGLALKDYDPALRARGDNWAWQALSWALKRESLSEELRVLYVALTRARQELILVGSVGRDPAGRIAQWVLPPRPALLVGYSGAPRPLDWFGMVLMRHPDGHALQTYADWPVMTEDMASRWHIEVVRAGTAGPAARPDMPDMRARLLSAMEAPPDPGIAAAWAWRYPHEAALSLPAKTSVTALLTRDAPPRPTRPAFMGPAPLSGIGRGTRFHQALQRLRPAMDRAALQELVRQMVADGLAEARDETWLLPALLQFAAHPVNGRVAASPRVLREQPFVLQVPSGDIFPEGGDEPVLIQGVIDLAFVEDGAWVLVDYKSNRVAGDWDEQALLDHYAPQLRLYARALARVTGLPVREAGLYLMATGRMAWLEADRL